MVYEDIKIALLAIVFSLLVILIFILIFRKRAKADKHIRGLWEMEKKRERLRAILEKEIKGSDLEED